MSPADALDVTGLAAAAPGSSLSTAAAVFGSSAGMLSTGEVSDMAAAVAQHKLQQMAALEVLQQQLQSEVMGLLPLI